MCLSITPNFEPYSMKELPSPHGISKRLYSQPSYRQRRAVCTKNQGRIRCVLMKRAYKDIPRSWINNCKLINPHHDCRLIRFPRSLRTRLTSRNSLDCSQCSLRVRRYVHLRSITDLLLGSNVSMRLGDA